MYMPIASLSPPPKHKSTSSDQFISRIYHLSASALNQLQDLSSTHGTRRTKLEAFSALLWKLLANASGDAESSCRLGIIVDGRSRLSEGPRSALFGYFGNVVSIPFGEATIDDLKSKPLGWAAKNVNEFLGFATNREHFQGLIDYVEGQRPNPMIARVCYRGSDDGPAIVVSNARVLDPCKMDFGWGLAFLTSVHCPSEWDNRYVLLLPSPLGNGDWVVYMQVFRHQLHEIEMGGGGILQPLTFQHLTPQEDLGNSVRTSITTLPPVAFRQVLQNSMAGGDCSNRRRIQFLRSLLRIPFEHF
ncbi:hypothetical protein EJ110_NYTH46563 [Nymphaea thermarum]|nr:hypothetical protein EJ110_NYTH46563 [Nymphaea thermarum]